MAKIHVSLQYLKIKLENNFENCCLRKLSIFPAFFLKIWGGTNCNLKKKVQRIANIQWECKSAKKIKGYVCVRKSFRDVSRNFSFRVENWKKYCLLWLHNSSQILMLFNWKLNLQGISIVWKYFELIEWGICILDLLGLYRLFNNC